MSDRTTETQTAFNLGLASAPERSLEGVPYVINPITGSPASLEHLLLTPIRKKDARKFRTTADFIAYVNRFKEGESSIYASGWTVEAEIDHRGPAGTLVHGDHTASIVYETTTALKRWLESNAKELTQQAFADLIEERAVDVVVPDSASMIEIAQTLHVSRNSAVTSVTRQGANHHLVFSNEQKVRTANDADIPSRFEIRLRPFLGSDATVELDARLRVSMRSDKPAFIYELQDYQDRMLETLRVQVAMIAEATGLPAYI